MKEKIGNKIKKMCEEYCAVLDDTSEKLDGLSSMMLFELVCNLEEEFDVEFSKEEITNLNNFSTVDNIVDLLMKKM